MGDWKNYDPGELHRLAEAASYKAEKAMVEAKRLEAEAEELRQAARAARAAAVPKNPIKETLPPEDPFIQPPRRRGRRRSAHTSDLKATIVREFEEVMTANPGYKDGIYRYLAYWHRKSVSYVKQIVLNHQKKEREWLDLIPLSNFLSFFAFLYP